MNITLDFNIWFFLMLCLLQWSNARPGLLRLKQKGLFSYWACIPLNLLITYGWVWILKSIWSTYLYPIPLDASIALMIMGHIIVPYNSYKIMVKE